MGKARRNKIAGRTNPKLFTNENLLGPVREAVLGELKQGKPKPSIIVVDTTTVGTNWMPRVVDDVTGVPGQPAAMSMYATPDEFAKAEGPDAQSLERVRLGLAAHPEDVVVCAISDHGVEIANVEMTAANADGHKVTLEQLSEAYAAKRQGMDELHAAAIERAVDVYGLDKEFDTYDGKNATQTQRVLTLVTKGLLNVVIDRTLKTREEGYHPAVI